MHATCGAAFPLEAHRGMTRHVVIDQGLKGLAASSAVALPMIASMQQDVSAESTWA